MQSRSSSRRGGCSSSSTMRRPKRRARSTPATATRARRHWGGCFPPTRGIPPSRSWRVPATAVSGVAPRKRAASWPRLATAPSARRLARSKPSPRPPGRPRKERRCSRKAHSLRPPAASSRRGTASTALGTSPSAEGRPPSELPARRPPQGRGGPGAQEVVADLLDGSAARRRALGRSELWPELLADGVRQHVVEVLERRAAERLVVRAQDPKRDHQGLPLQEQGEDREHVFQAAATLASG